MDLMQLLWISTGGEGTVTVALAQGMLAIEAESGRAAAANVAKS